MSADMEDDVQKEVNYWSQLVIERMINVTLMLASSNMAFRGHKEHSNNNGNCGNFLSVPISDKVACEI